MLAQPEWLLSASLSRDGAYIPCSRHEYIPPELVVFWPTFSKRRCFGGAFFKFMIGVGLAEICNNC